jgi:hypothetical protein
MNNSELTDKFTFNVIEIKKKILIVTKNISLNTHEIIYCEL